MIITIVAILLIGMLDGLRDHLVFHNTFKSSFWKKDSWLNKYASPIQPYDKEWYYFGLVTPAYKEKFPFSSTIFVGLTDAFHLSKTISSLILISILTYMSGQIITFFILYAFKSIGFWLLYDYILPKIN